MTKQDKQKALGLIMGLPTLAGIVVWAASTAFVPQQRYHDDIRRLDATDDSLRSDVRDMKNDARIGKCLQLSQLQKTPWQECL